MITELFPGFCRLRMHTKGGSPVAFVEYQDVRFAAQAMNTLQGSFLLSSDRGAIRIEYAKSKMAEMGKRKQWNKESMIEAIKAVRDKKMGYKTAVKAFNIPRATLKDYKISPKDIREVPAILPSTSNRRGEAFLVTGTPHKEKVQEATEKKRKAENVEEQPPKSYRKKLPFASSSHPLTKTLDPKITKEFSKISSSALKRSRTTTATSSSGKLPSVYKASSSNSQPSTSDTLKKKSALQQKRRKPFLDTSSDSSSYDETEVVYVSTDNEDSDDDVDCQFCGKPFSGDKCGEKWISCGKCYQWCHELCTSCEIKKHFICDSCLDV
uniref:HTH psq-type domain-containing protein n=1 Tax=Timema shepardi TaxID=629360 RepID=A0A7R9FUS8_TIMSH|nr:unnamed protein product [Timema shepardi]